MNETREGFLGGGAIVMSVECVFVFWHANTNVCYRGNVMYTLTEIHKYLDVFLVGACTFRYYIIRFV